jgi:hypothetical protein
MIINNMEERNIYQEYADIKAQLAELEERRKDLELFVLDDLDSLGGHTDTQFGRFTSFGRKVWDYSPKVTKLSQKLSALKKYEEETEKAMLRKVTSYVKFDPVKEVNNNGK